MKTKRRIVTGILLLGGFLAAALIAFNFVRAEYAYLPPEEKIVPHPSRSFPAFDLWGEAISRESADELMRTEEGRRSLSPHNGAIAIDKDVLRLGRESSYKETFGNEVFFTDIVGAMNGPINWWTMSKAILALKGKGTTDLQVRMTEDVTVGKHTFRKGEKVSTGLDVAAGSMLPLGVNVSLKGGRLRMGISCAACHSTVEPVRHHVLEGVPNTDLRSGLLIAMGSNSAAFFVHTDVANPEKFANDPSRAVITSAGKPKALPDPAAFEKEVDQALLNWPPGHFDSSIDLKNNPAQIPDSFTFGEHPYGWTGFAGVGPFKGLSALNNNVHAVNSDAVPQAESAPALWNMDKEYFLAVILQNAPVKKFRYTPGSNQSPSQVFSKADPTPQAPGTNELVALPTFPKASFIALQGTLASSAGYKVWEQNNAISAWQNTLLPPDSPAKENASLVTQGRAVFEKAGCVKCHAGELLTNNQIIPAAEAGTEPSRAKANRDLQKNFTDSYLYSPDTPVPLPDKPRVLRVPIMPYQEEQARLAWAFDGGGGYKVPGLSGLYLTAPYLHDGGAAAGKDLERELGMAGTLYRNIQPDPENSLRVLVDRNLRQRAVEANKANPALQTVHVTGQGHEYWVDEAAGFTAVEVSSLIHYLLSLDGSAPAGSPS